MIRAAAIRFAVAAGRCRLRLVRRTSRRGLRKSVPLLADGNANRVPQWEEKGVVFTLAHEPQQTKGKGC